MLALGLFLYSTVTQIWMIYLIHALPLGFAYSSAHIVVAVPILKHWFVRRQAVAIGVTLAGGSLGSSIMPQIVVQLGRSYDWRDAVEWSAVIPLALLPFVAAFLKETRGSAALYDAEVMMPSDVVVAGLSPAVTPIDRVVRREKRRNFVLLGVATFGLFFAGTALSAHIFLNLRDYGFSEQASASGLSLVFAAAFASKLLSGFFAERFQARPVWIVYQLLMLGGAMVLVLLGLKFVWVGILCLGFGWGGCFSLTQIMLSDRSFGSVSGRVLGWFIACEGFGAGSGGWLIGVMFDQLHSYFVPFVLCVLLIVFSILATLLLKPLRVKADTAVGESTQ